MGVCKLMKAVWFLEINIMYNCSISAHSRELKRIVKNLATAKEKELGLKRGSAEWCKMRTQIKRELLKKTAEMEQKHNYIAPKLRRVYCKKDMDAIKMFFIKYVLEDENGEEVDRISFTSDSDNLEPKLIKWCIKHRKSLKNNATDAEKEVLSYLSSIRCEAFFQKAFYICDNVYFADIYLPKYKIVIEIDGDYHDTNEQTLKDNTRSTYLYSIGIPVLRMSNEEAFSRERLHNTMIEIYKFHKIRVAEEKKRKKEIKEKNRERRKKRIEIAIEKGKQNKKRRN